LQNHGAITYGNSLTDAYERAQLLEWLADLYARAVALGTPRLLSPSDLADVTAEVRRRHYSSLTPVTEN
jgi:L-fuculose-phosphate aldolase